VYIKNDIPIRNNGLALRQINQPEGIKPSVKEHTLRSVN
jgi:hypothetical protein